MSNRFQNWNERFLKSFGPRFRIDVANPIMGFGGSDVFRMYGNTKKGDKFSFGMNESGTVELNADQRIDIIAGAKNESRSTDIVIHSRAGTIDINVAQNGKVKIRGNNIELDAAESITFNARSIRMEGADEISLQAPKVWSRGKKGNLVPKTWMQSITAGSFIGLDSINGFLEKGLLEAAGQFDAINDLAPGFSDLTGNLGSLTQGLGAQLPGMVGELSGQLSGVTGQLSGLTGNLSSLAETAVPLQNLAGQVTPQLQAFAQGPGAQFGGSFQDIIKQNSGAFANFGQGFQQINIPSGY